MVTLTTDRLILREFTREDFDSVQIYAGDPEVVKYMPWGPNTGAETRRFLEKTIQAQIVKPRTSYEFAIILDEELIGGCGLTIHSLSDRHSEIGYCIRRDDWGKGVGTEVAARLIEFGFRELGMHRITAKCDTENIGSYRVMEKNYMQREGFLRDDKNIRGVWRDSYLYSVLEYERLK